MVATTDKPLLAWSGAIRVPATPKFIAREKFVVKSKSRDAPVKIAVVWDSFRHLFLPKVEEPAAETMLHYVNLGFFIHAPILAELGDTAGTTLAHVYALMEQQPNGEEGALLTNGFGNIFDVKDVSGIPSAVDVFWSAGAAHVGAWCVSADSDSSPCSWHLGYRMFFSNSVSSETVARLILAAVIR